MIPNAHLSSLPPLGKIISQFLFKSHFSISFYFNLWGLLFVTIWVIDFLKLLTNTSLNFFKNWKRVFCCCFIFNESSGAKRRGFSVWEDNMNRQRNVEEHSCWFLQLHHSTELSQYGFCWFLHHPSFLLIPSFMELPKLPPNHRSGHSLPCSKAWNNSWLTTLNSSAWHVRPAPV